MPPRRRKNFFRIKPKWEGRSEGEKRRLMNSIRSIYMHYRAHSGYHTANGNRELRVRVIRAVNAFLPQNNLSGFFVNQLTNRYVDLIIEQSNRRFNSNTYSQFMRISGDLLDDFMGDSVTYYDNPDDSD